MISISVIEKAIRFGEGACLLVIFGIEAVFVLAFLCNTKFINHLKPASKEPNFAGFGKKG